MARLALVLLSAFCSFCASFGAPGTYTLDLKPPAEDADSVKAASGAIIGAAEAHWGSATEEFASMKQQLADHGKERVREAVRRAFARLGASA